MPYNDGGFYFLQPVGSGYGAAHRSYHSQQGAPNSGRALGYSGNFVRRPTRLPIGDEKLSVTDLDAIVARAKKLADSAYIRAGTYEVFTPARAAAEKRWAKAFDAYNAVVHMRDSARTSGVKWQVNGLPAYTRSVLGDWIKSTLIDPRYMAAEEEYRAAVAAEQYRAAVEADTLATGAAATEAAAADKAAAKRPRSLYVRGREAPSSPRIGTRSTPEVVTSMGAKPVVTEVQQAVAAEQVALREDAAATVAMAGASTAAMAGALPENSPVGFLRTPTGMIVAGGVLLGIGYLLTRRRES